MIRTAMVILWSSFLIAILAEGFFFSVFDPNEIALGGYHLDLPPLPMYTIGFFFFWTFCALSSMLTHYLMRAPRLERPPF
jgi:hypothetical protein